MCDDEVKEDPREKIFPNWYDLSIKYEGYETKGTFGTFHVVNTHESQRPFVIKLLPSVAKPAEEDPFICESLDVQEDEDFEWVKGKPKLHTRYDEPGSRLRSANAIKELWFSEGVTQV